MVRSLRWRDESIEFFVAKAGSDALFVSMAQHSSIQVGNAAIDAQRGCFVGSFIDEKLGLL